MEAKMKIFISWSGETSLKIAKEIKTWIPYFIQSINESDIFVSDKDIRSGAISLDEIRKQLSCADIGILCITKENKDAPWISFEAGAIAFGHADKTKTKTVIPFLFDVTTDEIGENRRPVSIFQARTYSKDGFRRMIETINEECENPLDKERLGFSFDNAYPKIEAAFSSIPTILENASQSAGAGKERGGIDPKEHVDFLSHLREEVGGIVEETRKRVIAETEKRMQNSNQVSAEDQAFAEIGKKVFTLVAQYKHARMIAKKLNEDNVDKESLPFCVLDLVCHQFRGLGGIEIVNPSPMWVHLRENEYFVLLPQEMRVSPKVTLNNLPNDITFTVTGEKPFGFKVKFSRELSPFELNSIAMILDAEIH
jgi:hypothetical protein